MSADSYELTPAQAKFLESAHRPAAAGAPPSRHPARSRFPGALPPVADQAVRGTCVASAVASLVACYEECRRRVSVQYLDEVTRLVEHAWVERNTRALVAGASVESDFEASFPEAVAQAALVVRANGAASEPASAFVKALESKILARLESDVGCRLRRCFDALAEYGICREELWPYSPVALRLGSVGGDAVGSFPPGTHEDARRHRIVNDLYILRAPNNVEEIKGILAGAQGRRPMPVCAGLELFEGKTDGTFEPPDIRRDGERILAVQRPIGIHEVLFIGYRDDAASPGGGYFTFQNSWGTAWGERGFGRVSYAYVACFCREAGTIVQDQEDFRPTQQTKDDSAIVARRRMTMIVAVSVCLLASLVSAFFAVWSQRSGDPARAGGAVTVQSGNAVIDYRYYVRGLCETADDARAVVKILAGRSGEFTFGEIGVSPEERCFEGMVRTRGLRSRPNEVRAQLENFLCLDGTGLKVRKWTVRRLRGEK